MAGEEAEEDRKYSAREWAGFEDASCTTQAKVLGGFLIEKAIQDMENHHSSIGDVFKTVAHVAVAVVAVITAVPSGGASLLALIPDMIVLSNDIVDNMPKLARAMFEKGKDETRDRIEKEYKEGVGEDISKITKGVNTVVSLVDLIETLSKEKTRDKSKYIALVQKGLEQAHELLLQQRQLRLAGMRADSFAANKSDI
ncbi:hypothetical protein QFC20_005019 [Naganishia adeliensis]|uniref:Uncharacterized protein n=1 Tax=Naganishia adeliensis TaxID=92952 RepID=A0ACC2VTH7_9TREE|nr:hypothetical protein QFC20_005019 [Naganishia adeliensis]